MRVFDMFSRNRYGLADEPGAYYDGHHRHQHYEYKEKEEHEEDDDDLWDGVADGLWLSPSLAARNQTPPRRQGGSSGGGVGWHVRRPANAAASVYQQRSRNRISATPQRRDAAVITHPWVLKASGAEAVLRGSRTPPRRSGVDGGGGGGGGSTGSGGGMSIAHAQRIATQHSPALQKAATPPRTRGDRGTLPIVHSFTCHVITGTYQ